MEELAAFVRSMALGIMLTLQQPEDLSQQLVKSVTVIKTLVQTSSLTVCHCFFFQIARAFDKRLKLSNTAIYIVMYKTRSVSFGWVLVGRLMNAHDGMPEFSNTKDTRNHGCPPKLHVLRSASE